MAEAARDGIADSGHAYARRLAVEPISRRLALNEQWNGLSQISTLLQLQQAIERDSGKLDELADSLRNMSNILINPTERRSLIIAPETTIEPASDALKSSLLDNVLPHRDTLYNERSLFGQYWKPNLKSKGYARKLFVPTPLPVNYVAMAVKAYPYNHPDTPILTLLAPLLRVFLHAEIREKGGAYGGGATTGDGAFCFYSYRDPHIHRTLNVYRESARWAVDGKFTDQDIHEALLSVMADLDAPSAPSQRGRAHYTWGLTRKQRAAFRERLLATTREDLMRVAQTTLVEQLDEASVAVIGSETHVEEMKRDDSWTISNLKL